MRRAWGAIVAALAPVAACTSGDGKLQPLVVQFTEVRGYMCSEQQGVTVGDYRGRGFPVQVTTCQVALPPQYGDAADADGE